MNTAIKTSPHSMDALGPTNLAASWGFNNLAASITFVLCPIGAGWLADLTGSLSLAFYLVGLLVAASIVPVALAKYFNHRDRQVLARNTEDELLPTAW